jgi:hypothetical protein
LQRVRRGRDDDALSAQHGGHEVRERLARPGAGLDEEMPVVIERDLDRTRHRELTLPLFVAREAPRERGSATEHVVDGDVARPSRLLTHGRGLANEKRRVYAARPMTTRGATKKIPTLEQYIASVEEPKRADVTRLHALIKKTVPSLKVGVFPAGSIHMIGYGPYHYVYESGREGDSYRVALSSNSSGFSIYVQAMDKKGYLAEQAKDRLGKASIGKSCIRFKKVTDLDLSVLADVLKRAETIHHEKAVPKAGAASSGKKKPAKAPAKKAAAKRRSR